MRAIGWATSEWQPSRCSLCRARRSWRISAGWSMGTGARIARACLRSAKSPATITFGTCWIRQSRPCLIRRFAETLAALERRAGGLASFRRLGDHVLIALDGTEYFCSKTIHCPNCSTRLRGKAGKEYFHAMLGATLVTPSHDKVVPLQPEFIVPQDGAEKQDCENAAAKRWLAAHAASYARLNPIYLGDDLFSRQPLCEAVLAAGSHFIFVCKPSSHPLIAEYLAGIELATRQSLTLY